MEYLARLRGGHAGCEYATRCLRIAGHIYKKNTKNKKFSSFYKIIDLYKIY